MTTILHQIVVDMVTKSSGGAGAAGGFAGGSSHGGSIASEARATEGAVSHMGEMIKSSLGGMADAFTDVVEKAGHLTMGLGMVAGAAGLGAMAYGVAHLNTELETTQISMGAIFQAQGFAGTFGSAFGMAADQLSKMKQDVKSLPGDLGQLSDIMKTIATPAAQAGARPDDMRQLAGRTMLVGTILGVQQDQGAREMAMLLSGRSGAHNVLGTRLGFIGDEAKKLNAAAPVERWKMINAELDKYGGAAERFSNSMVAQSTTLKDNVKYALLGPATSPLFESVKHTIADTNRWFDANQARVSKFAGALGTDLAHAWDRGVELAYSWGPVVVSFAKDVRNELEVVWTRFGPAVQQAAGSLKDALGNGTALHDIEKVLELYGVVKVGKPITSGAADVFGALGGGKALGALIGTGGGASKALAVAGSGVGLAGAAAAATVFAVAALGAAGELHALADSTSKQHEAAKVAGTEFHGALSRFTDKFNVEIMPALDSFGVGLTHAAAWLIDPNSINWGALVNPSANKDADEQAMARFLEHEDNISGPMRQFGTEAGRAFVDAIRLPVGNIVPGMSINDQLKEKYKHPKVPPGYGNINVGPIHIEVNSNADPSRVARLTVKEILKVARNPKSDPHTPNYSASR